MIDMKDRVALVLAPHPDDEVFGCGGFISRLKRAGAIVNVLYLSTGSDRHFGTGGGSTADDREQELQRAVEYLGIDDYDIAFRDSKRFLKLDDYPIADYIECFERGSSVSIANCNPSIVLAPKASDYHQDHRVVFEASVAALRPADPAYRPFVPTLLHYELPYSQWNLGESTPASNFIVRLEEEDLQRKIEGVKMYKSQLKSPRSPLSIHGVKTLAAFRGLEAGCDFAEAYVCTRHTLW